MLQMMTAAELAEISRTKRGEPTYAELKQQRDDLLAALDDLVGYCYQCTSSSQRVVDGHTVTCWNARAAIAKAKGE